uniref:Transketolase-like n=1 Tax=Phascolarctos cinereus TaxID=38626 RepID=A0A6P5JHM3_PHACI|nr:transketolase-like [Phascolarctos cinereus]
MPIHPEDHRTFQSINSDLEEIQDAIKSNYLILCISKLRPREECNHGRWTQCEGTLKVQAKHQLVVVIVKMFEGRRSTDAEDKESWHEKLLPQIMGRTNHQGYFQPDPKKKILAAIPKEDVPVINITSFQIISAISYKPGDKPVIYKAQVLALAKLGHTSDHVITQNGVTKNLTFSELSRKQH